MGSKYAFARATPEHIESLVARLRPEDAAEAVAAGVTDIKAKLLESIAQDGDHRAIVDLKSGRALAVLGVIATEYGASPWMMCADDINRAWRFSLRHVPRWVRAWARKWGQLHNAVYARNIMHQRFIERCGFEWRGEASINGHPFRLFAYVRR